MTSLTPQRIDEVTAWIDQDPDETTRAELSAQLCAAKDGDPDAIDRIEAQFSGPLTFGAAAGFAAWLHANGHTNGSVVIGFDARHNSDVFARDTAEIMAGAGFHVLLADSPIPTPVTAFGIGHYGAVAGVMVTASHNPPADNGYKVYLGDGSQIVPPPDCRADRDGLHPSGRRHRPR